MACLTSQLQHFSGEILEDGRSVYCSLGTNSDVVLRPLLQITMNTTDWELRTILAEPRQRSGFKHTCSPARALLVWIVRCWDAAVSWVALFALAFPPEPALGGISVDND